MRSALCHGVRPLTGLSLRRWNEGVHVGQGLGAVKLDFSAMSTLAVVKMLSQPHIQVINPSQLLADAVQHSCFDMRTATAADVDIALASAPRMSWCIRSDQPIHAIAVWFSCGFPGASAVLDTSPFATTTHWKQTLVYMRNSYGGVVDASFSATLSLVCDEDNSRQYALHKYIAATQLMPLALRQVHRERAGGRRGGGGGGGAGGRQRQRLRQMTQAANTGVWRTAAQFAFTPSLV
jgi:hypothetical protein